jgi:hypothetical protein
MEWGDRRLYLFEEARFGFSSPRRGFINGQGIVDEKGGDGETSHTKVGKHRI